MAQRGFVYCVLCETVRMLETNLLAWCNQHLLTSMKVLHALGQVTDAAMDICSAAVLLQECTPGIAWVEQGSQ